MASTQELIDFSNTCRSLALSAGEILRQGYGSHFKIHSKSSRHDLVTEYDQKSESYLIEQIKKKYPHHDILSEESGSLGLSSPYCWVIDPLDGTVNFAHQIPVFSVSIALCYQKRILTGCVYHPMMNELFYATEGLGAFLNDESIEVSHQTSFPNSVGATGFPYDVEKNPYGCLDQFVAVSKLGIPLRRLGSAAIDLCYVAAGRFDFYWESTLHPWDFAAGALIVKEAKGMVTTIGGGDPDPLQSSSILSSNKLVHEKLVRVIQENWL